MVANHVHDALAQVRRMQEILLEKRKFRGYSGTARALGGAAALVGAMALSTDLVPRTESAHLAGWGAVLLVGLALNYGALAAWFFLDPDARRDLQKLKPAVDALPPLAVGAALSVAAVRFGEHRWLFGIWMCLYGLVHMSYRLSLPRANYAVGVFYIACGLVCLLHPAVSFLNPWPMGLVFFAGESAGGYVFYRNRLEGTET